MEDKVISKIITLEQITKSVCPNGHKFCLSARCWCNPPKSKAKKPKSKKKYD